MNLLEILQALVPNEAIRTNASTVGTVAALVSSTGVERRRLFILNTSAATIYVGASTVTANNGYPVGPGIELVLPVASGVPVYCIAGSVVTVRTMELE